MVGVTVAPHLTKNDNDGFLATFNANPTGSLDTRSDVESFLPSHGWSMEDLTGEVHDLLLRESMPWLPWMEDINHSVKTGSPIESLDSQLLTQTLQLDGLFGQELNFDPFSQVESSLLYDEFAFDPSPTSTPVPSQDQQQTHDDISSDTNKHSSSPTIPVLAEACEVKTPETMMEERHDSSTDDDDDDDDDSNNDSNGDNSDNEQLDDDLSVRTNTYMYLPRRQVEETLLNKISHQLQSDKLPGILSIVTSSTDSDDDHVHGEEVEIDLSCLVREQLVRVMLYVDACITEQQGGPAVKLDHYLMGGNNNSNSNKANKRKERTVSIENDMITANDEPISMAALTKKSRSTRQQQTMAKASLTTNRPKRRRRIGRKSDQNSTPTTRPARRSALHKRRMMEDMLLIPSDNDDDVNNGLDQQVMVTYGEEEMDFKVVENQTIAHQPHMSPPLPSLPSSASLCIDANANDDDDDDDEEIDIM